MTWLVANIAKLLLPSWPCRPIGLPFLVPGVLETVFPLLPIIISPVAILLVPQPQPIALPLYVVHQGFLCLLEAFSIAAILPRWGAYFPCDFPRAAATVSTTHSLPVVWLFYYFLCASPWKTLFLILLVILPGGLCLQHLWIWQSSSKC